jgi:hypothetical protein
MAEKETIIFEVKIEDDGAVESIDSLRKSTRELTQQRNALNLATEEGRKKAAELNKQIDQNNEKIKENSDALTKQRQNVGNYTRSILDAIPGLKSFTGGINGIGAAFKANPIGLAITAFIALKGVFESNAVIADKLSFIMSGVNKAFQFVVDTIVTTVSSFDNLKKALFSPIQFFSDLATGTSNAAKAGYEAAESIDAFAVAQAKATQAIELTQVSIESLEKSLKDKTKSEQERIKIATEIANLEIENAARREKLAQQELDNEKLRLKNKTLSGDEEAALVRLQTSVLVEEAKVRTIESAKQSRINILLAKEEAAAIKEERDALSKSDIERIEKQKGFTVKAIEAFKFQELEITKSINADIALSNQQLEEQNIEFKRQSAIIQQQIQRDNVAKTGIAINQTSALFKKGSMEQKALASAGALINTYQAAAAALAPPPTGAGPIFGPIFAALAIASGLANVAKINATPAFANGGLTGTRIGYGMGSPINRSNGDNMLATVKTGEVILNQSQQARLGGAATFAKIGVPGFATGGVTGTFETSQANATASQSRIFSNLMKAIEKQKIVLPYEDFEIFTQTRTQIQETARVL